MAERRPRWRKITVNVIHGDVLNGVETNTKRSDVKGYTCPAIPGLAITPCIFGGQPDDTFWNVTHRDSGRSLPGLDGDRRTMQKAALQVAAVGNFDRPVADVMADAELQRRYFDWRKDWRLEEEEAWAE